MKKSLTLLLTLFTVLGLATGCGNNNPDNPDNPTPIVDVQYGTIDSPISVDKALEQAKKLEAGTTLPKMAYVAGTVTSVEYVEANAVYNIVLKSFTSDVTFSVTEAILDTGIAYPQVDDKLTINGYIIHKVSGDQHKYSMAYIGVKEAYPTVVKNAGGHKETDPTPTSAMGTLENPLTADQFVEKCERLAAGTFSTEKGYVEGKVTSVKYDADHNSYTLDIENTKGVEIQFYSVQLNGKETPAVGDTVEVYGYFKHHTYGTDGVCYEVAYNSAEKDSPIVVKVTKSGNPTPTPTPVDDMGSLDNPLTTDAAADIIAALEVNTFTEGKGYVEGKISDIYYDSAHTSYTATLECTKGTFQVYSFQKANFLTPAVGDTIEVYGYFYYFSSKTETKYEVSYNKNNGDSPVLVKLNGSTEQQQPVDPVDPVDPVTPVGDIEAGVAYKLDFTAANRTKFQTGTGDAGIQVYEANYIKVTNGGGSNAQGILDNVNPIRLYAGTTLQIECTDSTYKIEKIIFHSATDAQKDYPGNIPTVFPDATVVAGDTTSYELVVNDYKVSLASVGKQIRLLSIEVIFAK